VRVGLHCCFLTASPSPFGWPPKYTGAKMNLTKFYILWDAPEGVDTPHVLPLSICQSEYKTQDEFEADVFKRLEALEQRVERIPCDHVEYPLDEGYELDEDGDEVRVVYCRNCGETV